MSLDVPPSGGATIRYIWDASDQERELIVSNKSDSTPYEGTFGYSNAGLPVRISTLEGQLIKVVATGSAT